MKSDDNNAVVVENLYKSFRLPHEQHSGLKQAIVDLTNRNRKKGYEIQHVLDDISFEIKKGEFFGIVGRNGSGKSTLLKLLAGIYTPDSGGIKVNGTLVPFIELGVGFNPELTGRENVFLNGALLGFSRREMESMYDNIVEFAELTEFMDQKLKNYSSGMQVRLAFSIAIRADADILLLDEVLAVGDEAFQRKCYSYFAELKRKKKTVILVTHSMESVQQFCSRAMLIDKGHKTEIGKPAEIASIYRKLNMPKDANQSEPKKQPQKDNNTSYADIKIKSTIDDKAITFDFEVKTKNDIEDVSVAFLINREDGGIVYRWVLDENINKIVSFKKGHSATFSLEVQNIFPDGAYSVRMEVRKRDKSKAYAVVDDILKFNLAGGSNNARYWKPKDKLTHNLS